MTLRPSPITDHGSRITPSGLWIVVPVRGIADGKSRLATVLDAAARASLNRRLLATTLEVIGRWRGDLSRCVVVSPCDQALEAASRLGAAIVSQAGHSSGLDAAATLGASYSGGRDADSVLVLPCDLPRLTPHALSVLTEARVSERHFVIAPDRSRSGTNALLLPARCDF